MVIATSVGAPLTLTKTLAQATCASRKVTSSSHRASIADDSDFADARFDKSISQRVSIVFSVPRDALIAADRIRF